ncbi:MAG: histidine--tRNA ligase [Clostridia bacterium]|nr:histidine--tRNA ligase [Clostridia bacterium]
MATAPKGTKDLLPQESYKWQYIEDTAREVASLFNVSEIRTPTFEHTEVFTRGVGDTTDIVNKEMYTFLDKGERSITLKPEGTAGVARAFVENGLFNSALPVKLYYITPCFRYERPQAGRLREFHQFGVEFLGSTSPSIDAEAIVLADTFFKKLNVNGLKLHVNSIGCKTCRKEYHKALIEYYKKNEDKLCPLCKERLYKNPMRLLDCKNEECKKLAINAPKILDYICDDCREHFNSVQNYLKTAGIDFIVDAGIVRGLDYYTKTVFEFVSENIGAQGTVCGGGRYDSLIADLGGQDVAGIGFALGIERLLLLMENTGVKIGNEHAPLIYIAPMGEQEKYVAFKTVLSLREKGISAETDNMNRGIKAQFKYADKIKAQFVGVIGSEELNNGVIKIKDMKLGTEEQVKLDGVYEYLRIKKND